MLKQYLTVNSSHGFEKFNICNFDHGGKSVKKECLCLVHPITTKFSMNLHLHAQ